MKECYNYFVRDYKVGVKRNNNFDIPNTIERVEKRSSHLRTATAIKAEEGKGREGKRTNNRRWRRIEGGSFRGKGEAKGLVRFRCTKSNYGMVSGNHI